MATATKKAFPAKRGAPQIQWLLNEHGAMTVWELVDKLGEKSIASTWSSVRKSLVLLRDKGKAGVVNWVDEAERKKDVKNLYWYSRLDQERKKKSIGNPTGKTVSVEQWDIVR